MRKIPIVLALILCAEHASAATNNLDNCSQNTIQAAINAAFDGDIIACPAGSWSWSNVDIVNQNITLQGAGIDNTIISITAAGGIEATSSKTKPFRITGFTFRSTGNFGIDTGEAMMRIYSGKGWRVDHNEFQIYSTDPSSFKGGNGIKVNNDVAGLIDHNRFVNHPDQLSGTPSATNGCMHASVWSNRGGGAPAGVTSWDLTTQIGSNNYTLFIEDNYFREAKKCSSHNPHAAYGGGGGIYVFRHNEVRNMNADAHGYEATVGTREYEISNNNFIMEDGRNIYRLIYLRGGTGVVYNNTVTKIGTGTWTYGISLTNMRVSRSRGPGRPELYGGVPASSCCTTEEGYPCVDQIGRGKSTGTSPNKTQSSDPLYIWNNFGDAVSPNVLVQSYGGSGCDGNIHDYIKPDRDYYTTGPKPGYVAYEYPHPGTGLPPADKSPPSIGLHSPGIDVTGRLATDRDVSIVISDTSGVDDTSLRMNTDGGTNQSCGSGLGCTFLGSPEPTNTLRAISTKGVDWSNSTPYTVNTPQVDDTAGN